MQNNLCGAKFPKNQNRIATHIKLHACRGIADWPDYPGKPAWQGIWIGIKDIWYATSSQWMRVQIYLMATEFENWSTAGIEPLDYGHRRQYSPKNCFVYRISRVLEVGTRWSLIPIEISKIVRGHSSEPHFLDRNCLNSQFPYISWGKSKRSFMILYVNVSDHFLER